MSSRGWQRAAIDAEQQAAKGIVAEYLLTISSSNTATSIAPPIDTENTVAKDK